MSDTENNAVNDIKEKSPILNCSICGTVIMPDLQTGWSGGNNAEPINHGRCCNDCNSTKVIPARLALIYAKRTSPPG